MSEPLKPAFIAKLDSVEAKSAQGGEQGGGGGGVDVVVHAVDFEGDVHGVLLDLCRIISVKISILAGGREYLGEGRTCQPSRRVLCDAFQLFEYYMIFLDQKDNVIKISEQTWIYPWLRLLQFQFFQPNICRMLIRSKPVNL